MKGCQPINLLESKRFMKPVLIILLTMTFGSFQLPNHFRAYYRTYGNFKLIMSKTPLRGDSVNLDVVIDSVIIKIGHDQYKVTHTLIHGDQGAVYYVQRNHLEYRIDLDWEKGSRSSYVLGVNPIPQTRGEYQFYKLVPRFQ